MGEIHALRVKSPYKLMRIVDIKIENKPNEHGYLYLKCLIDDTISFNSTIKALADDKICVYEELQSEVDNTSSDERIVNINEVNERNSRILFNGIVQKHRTSNVNGIYYLEIEAFTSSIKLDMKEKSRSFQNINMTYEDLINEILKDYSGFGFIQKVGNGQKINKPLFQYKESDWSFLKRIASELKAELYCDIINLNYMFYFGVPNEQKYELEDDLDYEAFKDLKRFREAGGYNAGYSDTDYFYYEIRRRYVLEIGSEIYYRQKELYVREYEVYRDKEEIFYKYKLCRKDGLWQNIIYNELLRGLSLEGKVLAVNEEVVKLHLEIDESQNEDEAFWFPFLPPSVNIMYSMPLIGESVGLYFPNDSGEDPMIIGCSRKNGEECDKTSETTKRYFGTEHGSEIAMVPDALVIKGGCKETLSISFEDGVGVTFTSPQKLSLNADGQILMNTPNNVNINAQKRILMRKGNTSNQVSIEREVNIKAEVVIKNGSDRETFANFTDDEPQVVQVIKLSNSASANSGSKVYSPIGMIDQNGNMISFQDACRAATGNTPLCGTVITNGNSNSVPVNYNSIWDQLDWSAIYHSPGNIVSIGSSILQTHGQIGGMIIPDRIGNEINTKPRPQDMRARKWRQDIAARKQDSIERFAENEKLGERGVKGAIFLDVGYSFVQDMNDPNVPGGKVVTNAVVNTTFDYAGLWASTAVGTAIGGPVGAGVGFFVGLLYVGVTQVWKPDGKTSFQDRAKDAVYDDVVKAVNSQPIYQDQTKIDQEGHYPQWMQYMK